MEKIFLIVGLCILFASVAEIVRLLVIAGIKAFISWRNVARYAARARRAKREARIARARVAENPDPATRDVLRVIRG